MKLRDYQEAAVNAVLECWKKARSCLIVLPTGCGKTVVFGEIIRRLLPKRAMVLAHREELISQAKEKVEAISNAEVDVEMGQREAISNFGVWPNVIVSSVQTQITGRMKKFAPSDFDTLIIDEAHHATSKSYRACIDHYLANPDCRLLGVTATPDRADKLALGNVFETVAYEYPVTQAIQDGWLVPVRQKLVKVGSLDYSKISTCAGDFNQGELAEVLEEEKNLHGIASPTLEICGQRRAIIFAASVRQAERLAEIINRSTKDKADWLCGKTPKEERKQKLARFKSGERQFMVNVGVLTEGFDDAGVEVVVMARPTKSRALYAQMAGRATRPAAEIAAKLGDAEKATERRDMIAKSSKPSCLIVDFVGNSGRHKLVSAIDILGGESLDPDDEEALAIARERCEESEDGLDVQEEIEKAREEIKVRKQEEAKRRAFITLSAKYTVIPVDPFDVYDVAQADAQTRSLLDRRMLSWKQRQLIRERIGIDPDSLSTADGKALIDSYFKRSARGLATLKQTRYLRKHGVMLPMSFREANATISRMMAKGGKL